MFPASCRRRQNSSVTIVGSMLPMRTLVSGALSAAVGVQYGYNDMVFVRAGARYGGKSVIEVLESGEKVNNIEAKPVDITTPAFRDINIQNINCRNAHRAMFFNGLPEMPIERINLRNIHISADQDAEFFNCKGIKKDNVNITIQK